jgi:FG-GAP repeat
MALNGARPRGAALVAVLLFFMVTLVVVAVAGAAETGQLRVPSLTRVSVAGNEVLRLAGTVKRTNTDGRLGFEQTFTIRHPPASGGPLIVAAGRLAPRLRARVDAGLLTVRDGNGQVLARYGGLHVTDAAGHVLRSRIELSAGSVSLAIDAHGARYPLHVDPYVQIATLTPSAADSQLGAENGDRSKYGVRDTFGDSVAESANGDVLVVGAPADNSVFVFVKPAHGGWKDAHPVARLETNVQAQYPELGESVAVSADGKTIVAGEPQTSIGSGQQNGEVLVYTEPSNGWQHATGSPKAWLSAADTTAYFDWFGASVAINAAGDTIVIGAPGWKNEEGAIYVFKKGNHGWKPASGELRLRRCLRSERLDVVQR